MKKYECKKEEVSLWKAYIDCHTDEYSNTSRKIKRTNFEDLYQAIKARLMRELKIHTLPEKEQI